MSEFMGYADCARMEAARQRAPGNLATVAAVYPDGITLVLPGETSPSEKRYPYNAGCTFQAGQRVHIARESGTIIVEYPIGGTVNAAAL